MGSINREACTGFFDCLCDNPETMPGGKLAHPPASMREVVEETAAHLAKYPEPKPGKAGYVAGSIANIGPAEVDARCQWVNGVGEIDPGSQCMLAAGHEGKHAPVMDLSGIKEAGEAIRMLHTDDRAAYRSVSMPPRPRDAKEAIEFADLHTRFTYHPPQEGQPELYEALRDQGKALAELVLQSVPPSRERSLALTKIEEAVMWANAGIARRTIK